MRHLLLLLLLVSCIGPNVDNKLPYHVNQLVPVETGVQAVPEVVDTSVDTDIPEDTEVLEECVPRALVWPTSTDTTPYGLGMRLHGCFSDTKATWYWAHYLYDVQGKPMCGEQFKFESVTVSDCPICDFSFEWPTLLSYQWNKRICTFTGDVAPYWGGVLATENIYFRWGATWEYWNVQTHEILPRLDSWEVLGEYH